MATTTAPEEVHLGNPQWVEREEPAPHFETGALSPRPRAPRRQPRHIGTRTHSPVDDDMRATVLRRDQDLMIPADSTSDRESSRHRLGPAGAAGRSSSPPGATLPTNRARALVDQSVVPIAASATTFGYLDHPDTLIDEPQAGHALEHPSTRDASI